MTITNHPLQASRIVARTGLRMMPTFPRPSLSFRTAGFPHDGWRMCMYNGTFLSGLCLKSLPASAKVCFQFVAILRIDKPTAKTPALSLGTEPTSIPQNRAGDSPHPRGPRSGLGCSVPIHHHLIDPIRPTRRHVQISPHCDLYRTPSL